MRVLCLVLVFTILELQVQQDAVEQEPQDVIEPLGPGVSNGNAQVAVCREEGRTQHTEDELPGEVQTKDEQRHTAGLVFESAVNEKDVRDGPEDAGRERQDVIQDNAGRDGNGLEADLPQFRVRLTVHRSQCIAELRQCCEQI